MGEAFRLPQLGSFAVLPEAILRPETFQKGRIHTIIA